MQVHEWGGVFTDIVTWSLFRQFRPGLRIAINSHGGHYWSTQVPLFFLFQLIPRTAWWCILHACKHALQDRHSQAS